MAGTRAGFGWRFGLLAGALGGWLAAAAGCAEGTVEFEGGDPTTTPTGTAVGGAGGTAVGGGGTGGTSSACPVDCSTIDTDQCHQAICNEQTGQCQIVNEDDDTPCDDEEFCSVDDACQDGACVGGGDNDCGLTPGACDEVQCNEASQSCSTVPLGNGTPCTPANLCQVNATCTNGLCTGAPKDCTFAPVPNECFNSACNPNSGDCEPVPGNDGDNCTDPNDACLINGQCSGGNCLNTVAVDCSHLTQDCVLGVCDSNNGTCGTQSLNDGDDCDDLDPCTDGEICQTGQCTGGTTVTTCQDGDGCCPANCTAQNDAECAVILLFDSIPNGQSGASSRGPGNSCGTQVTIGAQSVTITKIGVHNDLDAGGNLKFMVWNHSGGETMEYLSAPQSFADNGGSWKESASMNFVLQANTTYDIGAIADVGADWSYDTQTSGQNGITSTSSNPNWTNYATPVAGGHASADCGIRLWGFLP